MRTLIEGMRSVIGRPELIDANGTLDYGAMLEYLGALLILSLVICCIFKIIGKGFA